MTAERRWVGVGHEHVVTELELKGAVEDEERLVDGVVDMLGRAFVVGVGGELELIECPAGGGGGRLSDQPLARTELQDVAFAVAQELG